MDEDQIKLSNFVQLLNHLALFYVSAFVQFIYKAPNHFCLNDFLIVSLFGKDKIDAMIKINPFPVFS